MKLKIKVDTANYREELEADKRRGTNMSDAMPEDEKYLVTEFSFRNELIEWFYEEPEGERDIMLMVRGNIWRVVNTINTRKKLNLYLNGE